MSLTIAIMSWHAQIQRDIRCEQTEKASMRLLLETDANTNLFTLGRQFVCNDPWCADGIDEFVT